MKKIIDEALKKIKKESRGRATAFVLGNTSDVFSKGRFYETPLRETSELIYSGVIVRDVATAQAIAHQVDGKTAYVFVDDEKKIRRQYYGSHDVGNIKKEVQAIIKKSTLITYKGNDLAVEATDILLESILPEIGACTIALIGVGNLGSKIALRLVERGAYVRAYRRNSKKLKHIVVGLNSIKSPDTIATVYAAQSISDACKGADVVLAVTNEKSVITTNMLKTAAPGAVLIDVGKGCFASAITDDPSFTVYRLDVSIMQKYIFSGLIKAKAHLRTRLGRKYVPELNVTMVSLGLVGRKDEIIVDAINKPSEVIGVAAGNGLLKKNTPSVRKKLKALKKILKIK